MFVNIILELLFVAVRYRDVVLSKNNPSFFYDLPVGGINLVHT